MLVKDRKKVYLLICGDFPELSPDNILHKLSELNIIVEVVPIFVFTKHTSNITPTDWLKIVGEIKKNYNKADGFVFLHQVDNLLYTAAAISFLLQNLSKPVVFTGAQDENSANKSGMKANLINASQAVNQGIKEVSLIFGNKLLRANQSIQVKDETLNTFVTPLEGLLGRIDFSIRTFDKVLWKNRGEFKIFEKLNTNIEVFDLSPVLDIKDLTQRFSKKSGIVINARMYKKLPEDLLFVLEKINKETPVVVWNRKLKEINTKAENIILVNNITWQTTVVKMMWVLAQENNLKKIKALMSKNVTGEILE